MPVIDLWSAAAEGDESSPLRECDVVIIGTGPAGSTIAAELASTGLRVTILESGDTVRRPEVDELTDVENVGAERAPQWEVRNRILGGSSFTWGGRSAPFDEIDFEQRSWVPASGWPYGRSVLQPFLERSAEHLGLAMGDGFSDERFWDLAPQARLSVAPDPTRLLPFYWQFSRDPQESYPFEYRRFGRDLRDRLGPDQTLVLGADAVRIDPDERGRSVRSVVYARPDGTRDELRARIVVVCAGGIENARLLLLSDRVTPAGLGNDHDLVGRYLMDHPRGPVATVDLSDAAPVQRRLLRFNVRERLFRAGFRLSPELQEKEQLLNASAWFDEVVAPDDPWDALRRLLRGEGSRGVALRQSLRGSTYLARGVPDYFIRKVGIPRKLDRLQVLSMTEQLPSRDSRITLSTRTDHLGVPLPRIDWRIHPEEARTVRRLAEVMGEEFERMRLPQLILEPWVRYGAGFTSDFKDVAHPTGTTRMSARPEEGVVDQDGQVHGVTGLYLAGSSTFPTAGHCNPTQMIVATSLKTADAVRAAATVPA